MLTKTTALLSAGIDDGLHIGAQLFVSHKSKILTDMSLGQATPTTPISTHTRMLWQSACKPLTALAIALLHDQNLLSFDQPVASLIPEFAQHGKDTITLRHLLTHTAGLRAVHLHWPHVPWEKNIQTLCENRPEPRWNPGEKAGYHPTSTWFILAEIIQRLTHQTWDAFLRQHVLAPLGMSQTLPAMSPEEFANADPTLGHQHQMKAGIPHDMHLDNITCCVSPRPPAGVHGPIKDLAAFYLGLLHNRTLSGQPLLNPDTHAALTTPQRIGMYDQTFRRTIDWSLGLIINSAKYDRTAIIPYGFGPHASDRTFGHGGSQSSLGMADPHRDLVVACIFNGCPGEAAHNQRIHTLLQTLYEEL